MDFAFSADQQLLRQAARGFLQEHCPTSLVRGLWEDGRGESEPLWKEMAALGWLGLALPEASGGSGLGMVETAILLEELGRVACPAPYLPSALAGHALAVAGSLAQRARWLPAIATGTARGGVVVLAGGTRAEPVAGGFALTGLESFVPWAHVADVLLVPARSPDGLVLFLVEPAAVRGLQVAPVQSMDPGTRWSTIRLEGVRVDADARVGPPGDAAERVLTGLLHRAAVGAAAEMLGAARRCHEMAVDYAKVREQFGQPIGSFQAIRHKCADMLVDVENAYAITYYAAWALDAEAEDAPRAASAAKAYVGEAARRVCGDAIQAHGGIGFTWEYDLHLYVKRARALEASYGDGDLHRELIVRHLTSGSGP